MLEAVLAVVILGVVGFALHSATLSGMRAMQMGKARAAQAKRLEYAIDRTRAETCLLNTKLAPEDDEYEFTLADGTAVVVRLLENELGDPSGVLTVEVDLAEVDGAPSVKQVLLLDRGRCP